MRTATKILLVGFCVGLAACVVPGDDGPETRPVGESVLAPTELLQARQAPDFEKHIKPILEERCVHCHNGRELPGKMDLSSRSTAFRDPRIIVPGRADVSMLIVALTQGNHALSMPAVGTAPPPEEIAVLEKWIDLGAAWPEGEVLRARQ